MIRQRRSAATLSAALLLLVQLALAWHQPAHLEDHLPGAVSALQADDHGGAPESDHHGADCPLGLQGHVQALLPGTVASTPAASPVLLLHAHTPDTCRPEITPCAARAPPLHG